jgi:hypothetical protein
VHEQQYGQLNCTDDETVRNALTHMIIKLRWLGLEEEARRLEFEARRLPAERRPDVSFGPFSTD